MMRTFSERVRLETRAVASSVASDQEPATSGGQLQRSNRPMLIVRVVKECTAGVARARIDKMLVVLIVARGRQPARHRSTQKSVGRIRRESVLDLP